MHVLLTGFRPFGEHELNPTELLMAAIGERRDQWPMLILETLVVETAYDACQAQVEESLATFRPDIMISFGLNFGSDTVHIEQLAINIDHARAVDNAGEQRSDYLIAPDGPPAYWATLPLESLSPALDQTGVLWRTSYHAGTYVCNHLLYIALHYVATCDLSTRCGFVHVPPLPDQVVDREGRTGLALDTLVQMTSAILSGMAAHGGIQANGHA